MANLVDKIDKNKAVIEWLQNCPQIESTPLYFNFIEAEDNAKQFLTMANEKIVNRPYIDGSVSKRYTFTIQDYRSISFNPLMPAAIAHNENVEDIFDFQGFIDWITEQAKAQNYPDFGDGCEIEELKALSENPDSNGVQTVGGLNLAKYSVSIQIDYLDTTETIWNK